MALDSLIQAAKARAEFEAEPANQAEVQRQTAEANAYRAAQTASMGALTGTPLFSSGVADPAQQFQRFAQSGYTGAQAVADGWGTGVGLPGWMGQTGYWNPLDPQGRVGAPYVNQGPIVPPPPAVATPAVTPPPEMRGAPVPPVPPPAADPYHPPGYTPGVAAGSAAAPAAPPPVPPPPGTPPGPPAHQGHNPTATPNIPGQPVTDFTYQTQPGGGQRPPQGGFRLGQQPGRPGRRGRRSTARDLGGEG